MRESCRSAAHVRGAEVVLRLLGPHQVDLAGEVERSLDLLALQPQGAVLPKVAGLQESAQETLETQSALLQRQPP